MHCFFDGKYGDDDLLLHQSFGHTERNAVSFIAFCLTCGVLSSVRWSKQRVGNWHYLRTNFRGKKVCVWWHRPSPTFYAYNDTHAFLDSVRSYASSLYCVACTGQMDTLNITLTSEYGSLDGRSLDGDLVVHRSPTVCRWSGLAHANGSYSLLENTGGPDPDLDTCLMPQPYVAETHSPTTFREI